MSAIELPARRRGDAWALSLAALATLVAVTIYRGWRHGMWINRPPLAFDALLLRFAASHPLPAWVRFSLPDALWQYAFGATLLAIWRGEPWHKRKIAWVASPFVVGGAVELGQAIRLVPGTFDWSDLAASAIAALAALVLHAR